MTNNAQQLLGWRFIFGVILASSLGGCAGRPDGSTDSSSSLDNSSTASLSSARSSVTSESSSIAIRSSEPIESSSSMAQSSSSAAVSSTVSSPNFGISSLASPSSSSASNSSLSDIDEHVILGKTIWDDQCSRCHSDFDENGFSLGVREAFQFSWLKQLEDLDLDAKAIAKLSFESVVDYISVYQPFAEDEKCTEECAIAVSAYIFDIANRVQTPQRSGIEYGKQAYTEFGCMGCHGSAGSDSNQPIKLENYTLTSLANKISNSMPMAAGEPNAWRGCTQGCAQSIAEYLWQFRPDAICADGEPVLPSRVRPLSKFAYVNTINDLFGRTDGETLASSISDDTMLATFGNDLVTGTLDLPSLDGFWLAAQAVANSVDPSPWLDTANCNLASVAACFVSQLGYRIFRRPLTTDEQTRYTEFFSQGLSAGTDQQSVARQVIQAMLVSPNFLYRSEIGNNGTLTQYEVATLLAYTFWGTTPDTYLLDLAASNGLTTAEQISQTLDVMLADANAQKQFTQFGRQWLSVDSVTQTQRDTALFPQLTADVATAMDLELDLFLQEMLLKDGYKLSDFFTWDKTFANETLANFYGLAAGSTNMSPVDAGPQRGGVLRLGAVLTQYSKATGTDPVARGLLVRRNLLCQEFGSPPPGVGKISPIDLNSSLSQRQRLEAHSQDTDCTRCHQYIDDIGFAFENYDAIGQYRSAEPQGAALDTTGIISGLNQLLAPDSFAFSGLPELSSVLANEAVTATSECLTNAFYQWMEGDIKADACRVSKTLLRWNPETQSIKDLWIAVIASQTFTQRQ